ncbi:hypothetical protein ACFQQB_67575 [Nonomuraea rubra]|uniref:hypothetical protein n=1 Tax=Nonomuraea rubra TaxID=46180 RepID=UPI003611958A
MSRFLRGGEPQDLRFFVRLHTLLDPTPAESAPRVRDYLRLLPSAPGTVAELAAGQVRAAMPSTTPIWSRPWTRSPSGRRPSSPPRACAGSTRRSGPRPNRPPTS